MLLLALSLAAGCAQVSFKRGASADSMKGDERTCRQETSSESAYKECMRAKGWYLTGQSAAPEATPSDSPTPAPRAAAEPIYGAKPSVTASPKAAVPTQPPVTPIGEPEAVVTPGDPLEKVEVGSWWKFGAGPGDLKPAIDACVGKLGEAHRPSPAATTVTAGLRACMREAGWFSVKSR